MRQRRSSSEKGGGVTFAFADDLKGVRIEIQRAA